MKKQLIRLGKKYRKQGKIDAHDQTNDKLIICYIRDNFHLPDNITDKTINFYYDNEKEILNSVFK